MSFYGGKPGASFTIAKSYSSVSAMVSEFSKGPSFTDVKFGETVIINSSDSDNGRLYQRGYNYTNTTGGAIFIGNITGPEGPEGPQGEQGEQGETGPTGLTGNGIASITEYYAVSTSATSAPSSFSTTVQTLTATNKYLWSYETVTYTSGDTESTAKRVIGVYGDKGDTGNGISKITEYYAVSSSNTTAPTSWNTTVQTMTSTNKYLWSYETVTYTSGSTESTDKRVIGVYGNTGNTGATGNGISSITEYYAVSSSNTTTPSSWSTTVQTMTSTNKYLWSYETVTYTSGSTESTDKRVIGVYGDKGDTGSKGDTGATGATGNGISSITEYYAVSASSTTAPTSWSTTPQVPTDTYKYLWSYETVTYTSGNTESTDKRVIGVCPTVSDVLVAYETDENISDLTAALTEGGAWFVEEDE